MEWGHSKSGIARPAAKLEAATASQIGATRNSCLTAGPQLYMTWTGSWSFGTLAVVNGYGRFARPAPRLFARQFRPTAACWPQVKSRGSRYLTSGRVTGSRRDSFSPGPTQIGRFQSTA